MSCTTSSNSSGETGDNSTSLSPSLCTSERDFDSGPSTQVISLLGHLKSPTSADIACKRPSQLTAYREAKVQMPHCFTPEELTRNSGYTLGLILTSSLIFWSDGNVIHQTYPIGLQLLRRYYTHPTLICCIKESVFFAKKTHQTESQCQNWSYMNRQ